MTPAIPLGHLGQFQLGWPGVRTINAQSPPESAQPIFILTTAHLEALSAAPPPEPDLFHATNPRYLLRSGDVLFNVRNRPFRASVVELGAFDVAGGGAGGAGHLTARRVS